MASRDEAVTDLQGPAENHGSTVSANAAPNSCHAGESAAGNNLGSTHGAPEPSEAQSYGPGPEAGPPGCHAVPQDTSDWASLPVALLTQVFDTLLRGPTPHPMYLRDKRRTWYTLYLVCSQWRHAVNETGVGACLPSTLDKATRTWLCKARIRGLEFHDPVRCEPDVYQVLSDPQFIERSGMTMQSLVEVPFNGVWQPSDYPNLNQLVVRGLPGCTNTTLDIAALRDLNLLKVLVLGGGFHQVVNIEMLPSSVQTLVWSQPGNPMDSRLVFPPWPASKSVEWLSLSANTMYIDPTCLYGHFKQVSMHSGCLLLDAHSCLDQQLADISEEEAALQALQDIVQGFVADKNLTEMQLNCDIIMIGKGFEDLARMVLQPGMDRQADEMLSARFVEVHSEEVSQAFEDAIQKLDKASAEQLQLHFKQHGPEFELTLVRARDGAAGTMVLHLDKGGLSLQDELPKLTQNPAPYKAIFFKPWTAARVDATTAPAAVPEEAMAEAEVQQQLLSSYAFIEATTGSLLEISGLLLPASSCPVEQLLRPYINLTMLCVVLLEPWPEQGTLFPHTLQELDITAAWPGQRFKSASIVNLVEMRRLALRGFDSIDLSVFPSVRPGFSLDLMDMGSRRDRPLGSPQADKLLPPGLVKDLNVHIGQDRPVPGVPMSIDLQAWAELCVSLNIQCMAGVKLYVRAPTVQALLQQLTACPISHLGVMIGVDLAFEEAPSFQTFKIMHVDGKQTEGIFLVNYVGAGMIPEWGLHFFTMEGAADEHDMATFSFHRHLV